VRQVCLATNSHSLYIWKCLFFSFIFYWLCWLMLSCSCFAFSILELPAYLPLASIAYDVKSTVNYPIVPCFVMQQFSLTAFKIFSVSVFKVLL
jgi:hypothetical protein